jgi:hypothetical protein
MIPAAKRSTMLEAHRDMLARDIRSHRDDWGRIGLPDRVSHRDTILIRHDDVHKHEIVSQASVEFRHRFEAI